MIEVLSSFECGPNTFFIAVDLMDAYLTYSPVSFEPKSIHVIGITSMVLASKVEEITPFKVSTAVEKMAHGKLTAQEIVRCERDILETLSFRVMGNSSLFVFTEMLLVKLSFHTTPVWPDVLRVITYITKMTMHDYDVLRRYQLEYIGCGCVYLCFKIIEQARPVFNVKKYLEEMKRTFGLDEVVFYNAAEDLLALAKGFETTFSFAKNLLKYDSFSLERAE